MRSPFPHSKSAQLLLLLLLVMSHKLKLAGLIWQDSKLSTFRCWHTALVGHKLLKSWPRQHKAQTRCI